MDLNYLLKIQERLNNTWNNLPKEVQEGKYSCPEIQEYNEIKYMFLGMGKMYYQEPSLTFEELQLRLQNDKEKKNSR